MAFELPNLPYAHDALEPHIDTRTMEIHHGKHHAGYTSKLNAAIEGTELAGKDIETLLRDHSDNGAVRNNGGGFWNHSLFWTSMSPNGGGAPTGALAEAIDRDFGGFLDYPPGKAEFRSKGWCPPEKACYAQMDRVFSNIDYGLKTDFTLKGWDLKSEL